ncbi:MarR family winged helix-turn-helix transcriptional regulator [Thermophilibacter immobilis]|uniref:MarR family transcriptional regulator n=1 Tax=Thermophilibacter immobilis TaxID=2779519 RepID=A0A7S7M8V9_9ACTN|nr:MarR family transcriptional regulator [Thermophilibacter immobilis]QOY60836.1 MarR family transcriptional regulator [Thermophilibacter immobilis]
MAEERFEDFVGLIDALHREIRRIKASEAEQLGFKGADVMCLHYLARHPEGLTSAELARRADVSRAAISRTVARLEAEGLVEMGSSQSDATRYRVPVTLTERGHEAARPIDDIVNGVLRETGEVLSESQRTQMYDSLNQILNRLESIARD